MKKYFVFPLLSSLFLTLLLFYHPRIIVNSFVLDLAKETILSKKVSWDTLDIKIENTGFFSKKISLHSSELRIQTEALFSDIKKVNFEAELSFLPLDVLGMSKIEFVSRSVKIKQKKKSYREQKESFSLDYPFLLMSFERVKVVFKSSVDILIDEITINGKTFSFQLGNSLKEKTLSMELFELKAPLNLKVKGFVDLLEESETVSLSLTSSYGDIFFSQEVNLLWNKSYTGESYFKNSSVTARAKLSGLISKDEIENRLTFDIESKKILTEIREGSCLTKLLKKSPEEIEVENSCKIPTFLTRGDLSRFVSDYFDIKIENKISLKNYDYSPTLKTENLLIVDDEKENQVRIHGDLKTETKKNLFSSLETEVTTNSNLLLECSKFENLIENLSEGDFGVPAPFNQLSGPIRCSLADDMEKARKTKTLSLDCDVNLKSKEQIYDLNSHLSFSYPGSKVFVLGEITVNKILFTAPVVSLSDSVPSFSKDKRILIERGSREEEKEKRNEDVEKEKDESLFFDYKIHVTTKGHDNLQIQSNLLNEKLPIIFDLSLESSKQVTGVFKIVGHDIELMRRKAKIENLEVRFQENGESKISGKIKIVNNDYLIFLNISGLLEKPFFSFESEPYLSEKDIIALVLFGKTQSDLDEDSLKTVEDTKAAVVGEAISLLSMYYLASTPIESVSYNPNSGVFSAKINLAQGLSLSLGESFGSKRLAKVRKVLGANWVIETSVQQDEKTKGKSVTMLKWVKKY